MNKRSKSTDWVHVGAVIIYALCIGMALFMYGGYMIVGTIIGGTITTLLSLFADIPWWSGLIVGAIAGLMYAHYERSRPIPAPAVTSKTDNDVRTSLFDTQRLQVNREFAEQIEVTEIRPYNAYCIAVKVRILESKEHGATLSRNDGEVSWFHYHPYLKDSHYKDAEKALHRLWELIYKE